MITDDIKNTGIKEAKGKREFRVYLDNGEHTISIQEDPKNTTALIIPRSQSTFITFILLTISLYWQSV